MRSEGQLELVLQGVSEAITVQDDSGRLVFANDAAAKMIGFPSAEALLAASPEERIAGFELLDEEGRPMALDRLPGRRALAGADDQQIVRYRVRATGEERWSIVRAAPFPGADRRRLAINTFHDITDRVLAERRLAFLAEASERLGAASLDWEETLHELAALSIPMLADWCIVDVLEEDGRTLREVTVAAADRRKEEILREMRSRYRPTLDSPQPAARALREGTTQLFPTFTPESLRETTRDERHFELISELAPTSAIAVPLVARGHTVGAVTLAWSESKRGYDEADVDLAEELARRAALAVDNARLYRAEQEAGAQVTFLAEVGRVLGSSLDYETTLKRVAQLSVPGLADWCIVDMLDAAGAIRRLGVAHADPERVAQAEGVASRPIDPDAAYGVAKVLRTGMSELLQEIPDEIRADLAAADPDAISLLNLLQPRSVMCVPLIARGRVLGAITLVSEGERRLGPDDLAQAEEVARRAAIAVDNARLFHEAERRGDAARVLAYVGDGVFLLDGEGVVRLWNRAAETITGLAARHVVGRCVTDAVPGWAAIADRVPIAAAPGAGGIAETLPLELPDRELWLSISGVGFPEGTVYAFRDLTQERALERLKSDFVSTVSHELRTPLAAIYGAALTLRRDDVELKQTQRERLLAVVTTEAGRLARTVDDILWTSRLDSGTLQVAIGTCDALALAEDIVAAARTHVPSNVVIELDAPAELPLVAGDPDKVRQVLANLVENAVKYSPDGGDVRVALEERDGVVRFAVSDRGLGIPPAERERIFDKFYRLDPEMTRGVGGTGLGLYICRELVRHMNGRIWVDLGEGPGSTFAFELPTA